MLRSSSRAAPNASRASSSAAVEVGSSEPSSRYASSASDQRVEPLERGARPPRATRRSSRDPPGSGRRAMRSAGPAATRRPRAARSTRAMLPRRLGHLRAARRRWAQCSHVWTNGCPVAASLWAISSSWWGKIRSTPPVWMSNDSPRWAMLMAEHSMCQPGRPSPIRSTTTARPASGPSRARSRGHRPWRTRRPRPARRPGAARDQAGPAGRRPATTRSERRSSRRPSGRRGLARAASR